MKKIVLATLIMLTLASIKAIVLADDITASNFVELNDAISSTDEKTIKIIAPITSEQAYLAVGEGDKILNGQGYKLDGQGYAGYKIANGRFLELKETIMENFKQAINCTAAANVIITGSVTISNDKGSSGASGGALFCSNASKISIIDSTVTFLSNISAGSGSNGGGALTCINSTLSFNNSNAVFLNNNSPRNGGAIYCISASSVSISGSTVTFLSNNVTGNNGSGGAITCIKATLSISDSSVTFSNNNTPKSGGAMCCENSSITFSSSNITFSNNSSTASNSSGGAVYCNGSEIT
jgi:predicted outer membrane repeat protein